MGASRSLSFDAVPCLPPPPCKTSMLLPLLVAYPTPPQRPFVPVFPFDCAWWSSDLTTELACMSVPIFLPSLAEAAASGSTEYFCSPASRLPLLTDSEASPAGRIPKKKKKRSAGPLSYPCACRQRRIVLYCASGSPTWPVAAWSLAQWLHPTSSLARGWLGRLGQGRVGISRAAQPRASLVVVASCLPTYLPV